MQMQLVKKIGRKIVGRIKREIVKARERKNKFHLNIKQKTFNVVSVKSWCETKNLPIKPVDTIKTITISPPVFYSSTRHELSFQAVKAELPEAFLACLKNVTVIDGSDMVIVNRKTVLYDEMAHDSEGKYEPRMNIAQLIESRYFNPTRVGIKYKKSKKPLAAQSAIHFCKDYSPNYFHWLIEALPRLSIVEQFPELDSTPLLVDYNLLPQQMEALHLINNGKREIIQLKQGEAYHIKNLYYPSELTRLHNNYYQPVSYGKDIIISPHAINYLRRKLLPLAGKSGAHRKIYISRKYRGAGKRLLNDDEISLHMAKQGFEVVHPENMTFVEQIKLFSEAEIIMGAAGAAFANIVFAPKECRVFTFSANNKQVNYSLFSMIAHCIQQKFAYILGQDASREEHTQTHNEFTVDISLIESALHL